VTAVNDIKLVKTIVIREGTFVNCSMQLGGKCCWLSSLDRKNSAHQTFIQNINRVHPRRHNCFSPTYLLSHNEQDIQY